MSTKIRLSRGGAKKRPYYRIVVTSSRAARDAAYIEKIGHYNPMLPKEHPERLKLDAERAKHWLSVGATPSDRVQHFLFAAGLVKDKPKQKPARKSKKDKGEPEAAAAVTAPAAAAPAAVEAAPAEAPAAPVAETPAVEAPAAEAAAPEASA